MRSRQIFFIDADVLQTINDDIAHLGVPLTGDKLHGWVTAAFALFDAEALDESMAQATRWLYARVPVARLKRIEGRSRAGKVAMQMHTDPALYDKIKALNVNDTQFVLGILLALRLIQE